MKRITLTLVCMLVLSSVLMAGLGAYLKYEVLEPTDCSRRNPLWKFRSC